ncbi:MAG: DNA polymerase III subunit beta [Pyrinomonadaceae bacterium]|nr:DNA polymerase III subunit beta [Acidobacteriota bacterium]MBP7415290.1 DNA polymerase III subunit beta [Pyrinomonadaceae bacterium]
MEFTIKQSVLKEELGFIQGVVERKTTIPVLANILIESIGEGEIRIVGTDLDVTIRCDAEAVIARPGSMCIQARKLFDIVRALESGEVHFKKEDNEWVTMKCGRANFRLAGVSREQFPEIPSFKSTPMKLPAAVFNYFIQNTAFAITNEVSRFTLSGAKFIVADGSAKMITTDGHRLAYIEKKLTSSSETDAMETLIPKKALLELAKVSRDTSSDISFGEDTNHLYFEMEGRLLISRKLSGQFPNYEMVMPKDNDKCAIFDLDEMRAAVRRVSLMADERNRSIRVTVREGEIELSAKSSEEGEGIEAVQAEYAGDEFQLGFNWQYLLEFLNNAGSLHSSNDAVTTDAISSPNDDEPTIGTRADATATAAATAPAKDSGRAPLRIAFEFKDANAQTQMSIHGDSTYDYKYIVMPLRI